MRHPTCTWFQSRDTVHLTLEHPNMRIENATLQDRHTLQLSACAENGDSYGATLVLRGPVSRCSVLTSSRNCPCIALHKELADTTEEKDHVAEAEGSDMDELSELSEEDHLTEDHMWETLLEPGCRNRFIKPDWSRWNASNSEPAAGLDMDALQSMLQQQVAGAACC